VHNAMFHPSGCRPWDETSRYALRQELNPLHEHPFMMHYPEKTPAKYSAVR
jgi:hypothetical protein